MWLTSHLSMPSTEKKGKTTRPHMSLSILAPMNPICTAMRDFVQTDYLALDNKQRGSGCMRTPECHCSSIRWKKPARQSAFRRIYIRASLKRSFLIGHTVIFAQQLTKSLLNPEQKPFLLILCFWTNNCILPRNASGIGRKKGRWATSI